jgi:hypothetical protein
VYVPWALYYAELQKKRTIWLISTGIIGILVANASLACMLFIGFTAQVIDHHIAYLFIRPEKVSLYLYYIFLLLYLYATAGSMILSTIRYMWLFGIFVIFSCIIIQIGWPFTFGSLWCWLAAIGSFGLYAIIKSQEHLYKNYE